MSLLVAIGVNADGYREILGIQEGAKEDRAGWSNFLKHLKARYQIRSELLHIKTAEFASAAVFLNLIPVGYTRDFGYVTSVLIFLCDLSNFFQQACFQLNRVQPKTEEIIIHNV